MARGAARGLRAAVAAPGGRCRRRRRAVRSAGQFGALARRGGRLLLPLALAALLGAPLGCTQAAGSGAATAGSGQAASGRAETPRAAPATESAGPAPPPPERVRVIYNAVSGSMMPFWVAVDSGAFREQGLDVEPLFIESGTASAQALVSGEAPLGHMGAAPLVNAAAEGFAVALFQATAQVPPLTLFTRDDLAVPEGLRGARLAVTRFGSSTDVVARLLLRRWALEPERDTTLIQLNSVPEMVGALQTGAVDAAVLSDPSSFRAARLGFRPAADAGELNLPYLHLGTAAPRSVLAERPALIRRYLLGFHAGLQRFFADPALAKRALASYTRQDDPELLELTYRVHAEKYVSRDMRPRPEALATILATASHPRARELTPEALIDDGPLRQLEAEGALGPQR